MVRNNQKNSLFSQLVTLIIALLFFTPLRALTIIIIPFLYLYWKVVFNLKTNISGVIVSGLYLFSCCIGVINHTIPVANAILSCWIVIPIFFLMFSKVKRCVSIFQFRFFLMVMQRILVVIDILGFIARFLIFRTEDEFGFAYGQHFQYVSGLAMMNAPFFLYHFITVINKAGSKANIYYMLFFLLSFLCCFFGLGLICLSLTLFLYLISYKNLKGVYYVILVGGIVMGILVVSNKDVIDYNMQNVSKLIEGQEDDYINARKVLVFINYVDFVESNPLLAFSGVGGGGFNGRVSFLLNKESDNIFTKVLGHHMPIFHSKYAYPLWNKEVASFDNHTDGTRNKPFSSLLSIASEGGIILFLFFLFLWGKQIKYCYIYFRHDYLFQFLFCLNILWFFSLLSEVWLESSEFIFYLLLNMVTIAYLNTKMRWHESFIKKQEKDKLISSVR